MGRLSLMMRVPSRGFLTALLAILAGCGGTESPTELETPVEPVAPPLLVEYDPIAPLYDPNNQFTGFLDSALPLTPTSYASGIQPSDLILVGAGPLFAWNEYTSYDWPAAASLDPDTYISFSVSIAAGEAAYPSWYEFTYQTDEGNANAAALRSSIDGFAADIGTVNPLMSVNRIDASALAPTSGTVEFRLYLYDQSNRISVAWITSSVRFGGVGFRLLGTVR